ncbi:hypothetical protein WH216_15180 [Xanthomonas perforans]|uniref:hypothetical protein n=1 Tax=Xanthomonas perforans TaxID=442694 RepID=UPI00321B5B28
MKEFSDVPAIFTSTQLLAALSVAPKDRVLVYADDLSDDEWDGSYATRTDINVLLVMEGKTETDGGQVVGVIEGRQGFVRNTAESALSF